MKIRPANQLEVEGSVALNEHVQSIHVADVPSLLRRQPPALEVADAFCNMIADTAAQRGFARILGRSSAPPEPKSAPLTSDNL